MLEREIVNVIEAPKKHILGLGLVIINPNNGKIWTVTEQKDKPKTLRIKGQRSIPFETMKIDETPFENLMGAMAEAFDDVDINGKGVRQHLVDHIYCMGNPKNIITPAFSIDINNHVVDCQYAVMFYDGEDFPFRPLNNEEVDDGKWVSPFVLLCENTRQFAQMAISNLFFCGLYSELLDKYFQSPEQRQLVFDRNFSIRETYYKRELKQDN